jgi:cell division septal protein FtsQ
MATRASSPLRYKANVFVSEPVHFRRKEKKSKPRKVQRRIKLKFRHILGCFLLISGMFVLLQRTYLFLISWDRLNVGRIEVTCLKAPIAEDIQMFLEGKQLGNLLILDIDALKEKLVVHPWIKDIRVRKSFPSTLKISILERRPAALLKKEGIFLIDREGVKLQEVQSSMDWDFPLFVDSKNFEEHLDEKLSLGWTILDSLDPSEREAIAVIDLTEYENAKVQLQDSPMWILIGGKGFHERMKRFHAQEPILKRYGPLEYVDMRFDERIYIKPQQIFASDISPSMIKEAK